MTTGRFAGSLQKKEGGELTHGMIPLPRLLAGDKMSDARCDILGERATGMLDPVLDLVCLVAKVASRGDCDVAKCFAHVEFNRINYGLGGKDNNGSWIEASRANRRARFMASVKL